MLAARGVTLFAGRVNISATAPGGAGSGTPGMSGGSGQSGGAGRSGGSGGSNSANQYWSSSGTRMYGGHGGSGGSSGGGGAGSNGGSGGTGGSGGSGGYGTPGMVKLQGSVVLAAGGTVRANNVLDSSGPRNGKVTIISNLKTPSDPAFQLRVDQNGESDVTPVFGYVRNDTALVGPNSFDGQATHPMIGELTVGAATEGLLQSTFWNQPQVTSAVTPSSGPVLQTVRVQNVFDGYDQLCVVNTSSDRSANATLRVGAGAAIDIGTIPAGRVWTTTVAASETFELLTYWTLTASAGPSGSISPDGAVSVPDGGSTTFTMAAITGSRVSDVLVDEVSVGPMNAYTFSDVTGNHTIHAVFQPNSAPVPMPGGPYTVPAGGDVQLDGSASSDPDTAYGDSIVLYEWDLLADGSYEYTGVSAMVPWSALAGLPQPNVANAVRLRVTDEMGGTGTAQGTLTILASATTTTLSSSTTTTATSTSTSTTTAPMNIAAGDRYAWSAHTGWEDYAPTHGGVKVVPNGASGYLRGFVWAENIGWIKLGAGTGPYANTGPADWGVNMDASGKLSGYAWSSHCGWINFSPSHGLVAIDPASGLFSGFAWGENIGWIHFRNASPAYGVRTTAFDAPAGMGPTVILFK